MLSPRRGKYAVKRNRRLALERLAGRLALLAAALVVWGGAAGVVLAGFDPPNPDPPIWVDPIAPGLAPIVLLPIGFDPPRGTVDVTPPPGAPLPADIRPLNGFAEQTVVNVATAFFTAHPSSQIQVTPVEGGDSYAVTVFLRDGDDFASYGVDETAALISVSYVMHDGPHSEILASAELTGPLDGGLVYALFDNDLLTTMLIVLEIGGVTSAWEYPEALAAGLGAGGSEQPGLANAAQLQALADLIDAHLDDPARELVLGTYCCFRP